MRRSPRFLFLLLLLTAACSRVSDNAATEFNDMPYDRERFPAETLMAHDDEPSEIRFRRMSGERGVRLNWQQFPAWHGPFQQLLNLAYSLFKRYPQVLAVVRVAYWPNVITIQQPPPDKPEHMIYHKQNTCMRITSQMTSNLGQARVLATGEEPVNSFQWLRTPTTLDLKVETYSLKGPFQTISAIVGYPGEISTLQLAVQVANCTVTTSTSTSESVPSGSGTLNLTRLVAPGSDVSQLKKLNVGSLEVRARAVVNEPLCQHTFSDWDCVPYW